jgi:hypothetical protein
MNKILALTVIVMVPIFSSAASEEFITIDSHEQFGSVDKWHLVGLGSLCFIELRRMRLIR